VKKPFVRLCNLFVVAALFAVCMIALHGFAFTTPGHSSMIPVNEDAKDMYVSRSQVHNMTTNLDNLASELMVEYPEVIMVTPCADNRLRRGSAAP